jgi:predicted ATP-grasp superfamily ATP-dependent carboligase
LLRTDSYDTFSKDLISISEYFSGDQIVYVPASETVTLLFYEFIAKEGRRNFLYVLPDEETFNLCRNKYHFQSFCEENNLPVPASFSIAEVKELKQRCMPLVVKPRIGAGSVGLKYLTTSEDLNYLNAVKEKEILIQQKIKSNGTVEGAFFLSVEGKVIQAFSHRRIRTFPDDGGVTVYSESTYNEPIIAIGKDVLSKLKWSGLAMIEFMYDEDEKQWRIIELNPRLWGSVLLSAFNNSGMLLNYVELSNSQKLTSSEVVSGKMIRWYYPYEILNLFKRNISIKELLTFNRRNTCYINATYAGIWQTVAFQYYMTFNLKSIKRFFQKTLFRK